MLPVKTFVAGVAVGFIVGGWSFWHVALFLFGGRVVGLLFLFWHEARGEKTQPHSQQNRRVRRAAKKREGERSIPGMVSW